MDYPITVPGVGLSAGKFTNGNPLASLAASLDPAEWANAVTDEILNVITQGGLTPAENTNTQLATAIKNMIRGGDYKDSVRFTTTANIVLTGLGTQAGGDWPAALTAGERIFPKNQTAGAENGIWIAAAGAWTRATDADTGAELNSGAIIPVEAGTANADSNWQLSTDGVVIIGTTPLTFVLSNKNTNILHGQCNLSTSGANLILLPRNGNQIIINGAAQNIPAAGVTLAAPATTLTLYYIYAYMVGAVITLEASVTAHATDATTGIQIKAGDTTRTLVGMARTVTNAWVDTRAQRFVRSWFNPKRLEGGNAFVANRSTGSFTYVELSASERAEFLCWANETIALSTSGRMSNSASGGLTVDVSIGIDGTSPMDTNGTFKIPTGSINYTAPASCQGSVSNLTEGYHYATILGATFDAAASTCTFFGSATPGQRCTINVLI